MIIGITGLAGSGKDTFARLLVEELEKRGRHARTAAFAAGVKEATVALLGDKYTIADLNNRGKKDTFCVWSTTLREIMQDVGAYGRQIDPDFWIDRLFNESMWVHERGDVLIVTDVRYDNEGEAIKNVGGVSVEIVREGAGLCGKAGQHPSEAGLLPQFVSFVYSNNGSIEELRAKARLLLDNLLMEPAHAGEYDI